LRGQGRGISGELKRHFRDKRWQVHVKRPVKELALQPSSLDAPLAGQPGMGTLADLLGGQDPRIEHMLDMNAVAAHWGELPPREQKILLMDFSCDMSQTEIGRRLGISQMHVSRLRARALGHLRSRLLDLEEQQAS
jgi:RNA polymerase sigma-B factor